MAFRSRLEQVVDELLTKLGVEHEYEGCKLGYSLPCQYTPDFKLSNGIFLETKGYFSPEDRRKTLAVLRDNPGIDLRMVFSNPNNRLSKTSKTTYGTWCRKHGILYCASHSIPIQWLTQSPQTQTQTSSKRSTASCQESSQDLP